MLPSWENGYIEYMRQRAFPPIPRRCQPWGEKRVLGKAPFKLNDLVGVFALFIGGCIIVILGFITEFNSNSPQNSPHNSNEKEYWYFIHLEKKRDMGTFRFVNSRASVTITYCKYTVQSWYNTSYTSQPT